jgi:tetratricopeptide (TPR) repeat protein
MKPLEKTCFVIIGYGIKTDHIQGREIDLDKTYEYIIKPVFENLGFLCFRASDIKHSGSIDIHMYENILKADFVLADLTTLNPNVLYELGIRHAVRKNTTIIISEEHLQYPFDLSHIAIEKYEHLGKAIDFGEVERFRHILTSKINSLLLSPEIDSPLYTFFPSLQVPRFTHEEINEIKHNIAEDDSLSDLMIEAETAKDNEDYSHAIKVLEKAKLLNQDNILITQRLALSTYKSHLPSVIEALHNAMAILESLNPLTSTDLETLGLSGAINKRLFEQTCEMYYLNKSIWFYEKGYYIGNDYYNGINLAYLYNVAANMQDDRFLAYSFFGNAIRIRNNILEICNTITISKGWESRDDKYWVFLTLAEIMFSFGDYEEESLHIEKAKPFIPGTFSLDSYYAQRERLGKLISEFEKTPAPQGN